MAVLLLPQLDVMIHFSSVTIRKKAVWGPKRTLAAAAIVLLGVASVAGAKEHHGHQPPHAKPGVPGHAARDYKIDDVLQNRAKDDKSLHWSSVIVELAPGAQLSAEFKRYARPDRLDIISSIVLDLPDAQIKKLASQPGVIRLHDNRPIKSHNYTTSITVGARTVQDFLGLTGSGVGIAVIDSGITSWHDDLTNRSSKLYPYGNQRVAKFVDFVNGRTLPYDDNGHGSHVAGTILGNGYDSLGLKAGIAPGASLVALKVLDANSQGSISNVIAALTWISQNYKTYNIRVVNLSVGSPIRESYWTDPLTLAAKKITDLGITVVTAAGNTGKNAAGHLQWGGISAPGNAPWVLTVGASSTMGTLVRSDDTMADYSSSGPTYIDFGAKPDLVAPGTGTVSLAVPGSTFYATKTAYLLAGILGLGYKPYLALSGTSMAAPVVSGTVALMLQANPSLTPNLIKAILQYTAQEYRGYSALRQGAGFLNTLGAVRLAQFYAANKPGSPMPLQTIWSRHVIWGNHEISGGYLNPLANAWATNVVWGTARTAGLTGQNIVWGTACADDTCDNIVWGTADATGQNVVWGTNLVWGTSGDLENVVWGTADGDENIVWGTDCGGSDCENVVWGTADTEDNIVWGTADGLENVVWGTSDGDENIVWGTNDDSSDTVFPDDANQPLPSIDLQFGDSLPLISPTTSPTGIGGGL